MKSKIFQTNTLVVLGFLFALSIPSSAQWKDNMGGNWNNPTSASIGNILNDRLWNRLRAKAKARRKAGGSTSSAETPSAKQAPASEPEPPKKKAHEASLKFRSTGRSLHASGLADQLGSTAEEKQQYLAIMEGVLKGYIDEAARLGHPNDISLALAFFLLTNTIVYHEIPEPTDAQFLELRDVFAEQLLESDALKGVSDHQKQEMSETLVVFTGLAVLGYQSSLQSGDAAAAKGYRQLAGQNLQTVIGISPDKITFGVDGLMIDNGSKAEAESAPPVPAASSSP